MGILHRLRHSTARRTTLLGLLLLLVGWQDLAAQSHFHVRAGSAVGLAGGEEQGTGQGKHTPGDGLGTCSLCQIVLGGSAPLPRATALLLAPVLTLLFLLPARRRVAFLSAVSHSWQGRGPPLL